MTYATDKVIEILEEILDEVYDLVENENFAADEFDDVRDIVNEKIVNLL